MRRRTQWTLVLVLWTLACILLTDRGLAATFRRDANGNPVKWDLVSPETHTNLVSTNVVNPKTRAVRFFLANDGWSTTNKNAELNAVRAAFAVWQATPNSILKFEEGGMLAPGLDVNEVDGTNVVFWAKDSTFVAGGTVNIVGATAVTFRAHAGTLMVGADIVLNGVNYLWFTDCSAAPPDSRYYFVESIVTHEIGHFIGLEHSPVGGATMFYRSPPGIGTYIGLSGDERLGVQILYPKSGFLGTRGTIQGKVTSNSTNVFGAVVVAEDTSGNVAGATLTWSDGTYTIGALVPGSYTVRVCPLDAPSASPFLVRGSEIGPQYSTALTTFLPTYGKIVNVVAERTALADFEVKAGVPNIRICGLRPASKDLVHPFPSNSTIVMRPGESNYIVGVYSRDSLAGASLSVTGNDVTLEPLGVTTAYGYNLIYGRVSVSPNAVSGLRSFVVSRGETVAYANGFFEIMPAWFDDNYDGLDDMFQRRYFSSWISPEAGPDSDPDKDGFNNRYEYLAGSDPTTGLSVPSVELENVTLTANGAILSWNSVPGARYQVWARDSFAPSDAWRKMGGITTASSYRTQFVDSTATNYVRFYLIELLPGL